ncbi:MAG: bifunctional oligoribonuclease and phosphatase NrnA [bacterium]|nr:bifunctional oligoribonuclease and phosphatase NrnA [bacterium]
MEKIKQAKEISIISHERPDGDAIGSLLAMGLGIERLGKTVKMFTPDGLPRIYSFLSGSERIRRLDMSEFKSSDLCIFLDTANPERIGDGFDLKSISSFIINIDHHIDNKVYGDINLIDPSASATGELVYEILQEEEGLITREVADALYTAILTDSGRFSHSSTSPKTHIIVADLLSKGADKTRITRHLYENKPFSLLKLIGKVLDKAEIAFDGRVIWSSLSERELKDNGFDIVESEGFLYFLRMSEGAKIVILFREMIEGKVRVSLRSNDEDINVRLLASRFGGGGHDMAAACTLDTNLEEAKRLIFEAIREMFQWKA